MNVEQKQILFFELALQRFDQRLSTICQIIQTV